MRSGTRLGPYEVTGLLGEGGMGEVYRARDTRLGRDVAVKVLPEEFASEPERVRRFEQEARALAALNHPSVLAVYDVGLYERSPYLVTELLEGESLQERLERGPIPVPMAVGTAVQIARGLAATHEKGIIHRDLKPGNVFLTRDGQVKILDFGVAKLAPWRTAEERARATTVVDATDSRAVLGTVGYMSPEQIRGHEVDCRSDIFAFGCVLYEMLSGRPPFHRETAADTTSAILHEEPRSLTSANREIPPGLAGLVGRCLAKDPGARLSSAHDLAIALQSEAAAPAPLPSSPPIARGRHGLLAGALALTVAAAVAVLVALGWLRGARRSVEGTRISSIAVLPLANLSGDPAQEYFSDGMTEELTATLAQLSALKVISRTSAQRFKGAKGSVREIASALGVKGIIEGSVLRVADRVRITVQLIDAGTDSLIWAESYDRDLRDVLSLQNEVARAIAGEIRAKLTSEEQTRLAIARRVNPEAYALCLQGWTLLHSFQSEEFSKALEYFQRAIDLDPTYAPAYAAIGTFYVEGGSRGYQAPYETIPKAKAALRRALELDEGGAEAHAALGNLMFWYDWDWSGAEVELRRAIALAPNSSITLVQYANYLGAVGRPDEALAEFRLALERDPLAPNKGFGLGVMLYYARRYDDSIAQLQKALKDDPPGVGPMIRTVLAMNFAQKKLNHEAVAECDKAIEGAPEEQPVLSNCGNVYGRVGSRRQAVALQLRLESQSARQYVDPYGLALISDGLGDNEGAFKWLDRSFKERSPNLWALKEEPWSDRLRSDPRFEALVRRMNYPPITGP